MTNPKPTVSLKRDGTFRNDRHGRMVDAEFAGAPVMPRGLDKQGKWLWRQIIDNTPPGILVAIDASSLQALCRWWSAWDKAMTSHEKTGEWKDACKAGMAWKHVAQLLSRFGASPVDRARIKAAKPQDDADPLDSFFKAG